jgi:hypothetical protein
MAAENPMLRSLAKDWSVSGIFTYHSGNPEAFTGSGCAGTPMGTCMPTIVPGVNPRTQSYNKPTGGKVAATGYANTYSTINHLNYGAFTVLEATNTATGLPNSQSVPAGLGTAAYVPGNAARVGADNVFGMGFYNVDLGLKRSFPIWENVKLQIEADLLNATNHVVWPNPNGVVGSGSNTSTTVTATYGLLGAPTNNPRDLQLSGRINW